MYTEIYQRLQIQDLFHFIEVKKKNMSPTTKSNHNGSSMLFRSTWKPSSTVVS